MGNIVSNVEISGSGSRCVICGEGDHSVEYVVSGHFAIHLNWCRMVPNVNWLKNKIKNKSGLEIVEKMSAQKGPHRWKQRSSPQPPERSTDSGPG